MSQYMEFPATEGSILIEVDEADIEVKPGMERAGLFKRKAGDAVAVAETSFDTAITRVLRQTSVALLSAVDALPRRPDEVELTFALKATGEVGNIAIAKAGAEAQFTLRLAWTNEASKG